MTSSSANPAPILVFPENKLVIATHNAGKVKEFANLFNQKNLQLCSAGELGLAEPEETGQSFTENSRIKSRAAALASGLAALADDSGICVDALDDAPGIYSARWGINKSFIPAFDKIHTLLNEKSINPEGAKAAFIAVLVLRYPDGREIIAEGRVDGRLTFPPRGTQGHGYDPIFIPDGDTRTFAEMSLEEKQRYSHRAKAVEALLHKLRAE